MPTFSFTESQDWVVPNDWNNNDNLIICIGGGSSGWNILGGSGGACAKSTNVELAPGSTQKVHIGAGGVYVYGAGGDGGDTWFGGTSFMVAKVAAEGAKAPISGSLSYVASVPGLAANSIGDQCYDGGYGAYDANTSTAGGGGGAAGPNGAGKNGSIGSYTQGETTYGYFTWLFKGGNGGAGDDGAGGAGGAGATETSNPNGHDGYAGIEIDGANGAGGGGGAGLLYMSSWNGQISKSFGTNGAGGWFGGGGAGSIGVQVGGGPYPPGNGRPGFVFVSYTPIQPTGGGGEGGGTVGGSGTKAVILGM